MLSNTSTRASKALLVSSTALVVAPGTVIVDLIGSASASSPTTIGPYVSDISASDVLDSAVHLDPGEVGSAMASCPEGEILVSGRYRSLGSISALAQPVTVIPYAVCIKVAVTAHA